MTYQATEQSVHGAEPVELYRFAAGGETWTYTSGAQPHDYLGQTYAPLAISRSAPTQGNDRQGQITLTVARDNPVAALFRVIPPGPAMTLTVYRVHPADGETVALWTGRVRAVAWAGSEAQLTCDPVTGVLARDGLRYGYTATCNHLLYSGRCGVNALDHQVIVPVAGISTVGDTLTSAALAGYPDQHFRGGFIVRNFEDYRMILASSGGSIVLLLPFEQIDPTDTLNVYPGCDRTLADCEARYNNVVNFGGFPFVPPKNPFDTGIE